ncbi:MAG: hypothetical protein Q7S79_00670, partial [bacterium]|nr:hypothetical protein [bacterium]
MGREHEPIRKTYVMLAAERYVRGDIFAYLERMYNGRGNDSVQIAEGLDVKSKGEVTPNARLVRKWMEAGGIPRRTRTEINKKDGLVQFLR